MKIVIIGAGSVGFELARTISRREHDVTLVEKDPSRLDKVAEHLDCRFVTGSGVSPKVLREVKMRDCDLFTAVTDSDEINIIACQTAHVLGARVKVARVRQEDYYQDHRLLLDGISMAINPQHEAVHSIREILLQTGATEIHEFAGGKVRISGTRVETGSKVEGKTLAEIHRELGQRIALVTTIVRDGETLIPRGHTVIKADDQVFMAGPRSRVDRSLIYFRSGGKRLSRVMIVGANDIGLELARDLLAAGVKVKIIDRDEGKCRLASEQLRHALVLCGEGADSDLLDSEGVGEMDGFVSVSGREETNIMACLLARHHGAGKTVCLVNRTDYVPLLPLLGVDAAVSPRLSTSTWISSFVKRGAVINSERLGYSGAEILQLRVGAECSWLGQALMDLDFPPEAVIGAVLKRGRVLTPTGSTLLEVGDEVVVFALPGGVAAVENFFAGGQS
ncbi:MAG: Trk system potassium transporter TrkA [Gemmatimonadales bacterium]|nr:Trk system potassium transporter TrkA [Gemmatimonadales bacterium]